MWLHYRWYTVHEKIQNTYVSICFVVEWESLDTKDLRLNLKILESISTTGPLLRDHRRVTFILFVDLWTDRVSYEGLEGTRSTVERTTTYKRSMWSPGDKKRKNLDDSCRKWNPSSTKKKGLIFSSEKGLEVDGPKKPVSKQSELSSRILFRKVHWVVYTRRSDNMMGHN